MKKILTLKNSDHYFMKLHDYIGRNEITVTVLLVYVTALLEYFDLWLPNIVQVNFSHDPLTKRVFQTLGYFLGTTLSFHRLQRKCETDGGRDPVRLREKLSGGFSSEFS